MYTKRIKVRAPYTKENGAQNSKNSTPETSMPLAGIDAHRQHPPVITFLFCFAAFLMWVLFGRGNTVPFMDCSNVPSTGSVQARREDEGENQLPSGGEPAASYSRFSSDLQSTDSIASQQRHCCQKATENGHCISSALEYADEAVSGTKLRRTGLDALLMPLGRDTSGCFTSIA